MTVRRHESARQDRAHLGGKDIGWQALGPALACALLATAVVSARWFARNRLSQCGGLDDWSDFSGQMISWVMTALIAAEVNGGAGTYSGPTEMETIAKLVVASNCLWIFIVNITKASILLQYLRIFQNRFMRYVCYSFLLLLVPAAAWGVFGGIFLCSPIAKLWNPKLSGQCMNARTYWISVAGIDIGLDFFTLALPLPSITRLHLARKQKVGLVLFFILGFFVCIVSAVRLLTVLITSNEGDYIASGIWAIVWSAVEANAGIICACLLSLKPLFAKLLPGMMEDTKPPRHSMRLPMIDACGRVWRNKSTSTYPNTVTSPVSPSTPHSGGSSFPKMSSGTYFGNPLSQMKDISVVEPEWPAPMLNRPGRPRLSLFEMLQEDEDEARAQLERKNSSFTEHV